MQIVIVASMSFIPSFAEDEAICSVQCGKVDRVQEKLLQIKWKTTLILLKGMKGSRYTASHCS